MRLTYMYYLLKNNYNVLANINAETKYEHVNGTKRIVSYTINDWETIVQSFNNVNMIDSYKGIITDIYETVAFAKQPKDHIGLTPDMYQQFMTKLHDLTRKIEGVLHFFDGLNMGEHQNGFDVKMPPTKDFAEFSEQISDFQKLVLNCPYLRDGNEKVSLQRVDIGSIWICFAIVGTGTALATTILSNLGKIVDKAVKIKSHILTCKQQEEILRSMKQKNDVIDSVINGFKAAREELLQNCVDQLKDEIKGKELKNGEEEEQVKKAIDTLGELMSKGMEIYASIEAPNEVKDLFPTSDEIKSLNEPIKLLTEEAETKSE